MNPVHLKSFVTIANHGSFSKAAKALFVSTQALFQQMEILERAVGVPLFQRSHTGVVLTSAGSLMYEGAKHLLSYSDTLLKECRKTGEGTALRVGTSHEVTPHFLYLLSRLYREMRPENTLRIIHTDADVKLCELMDAKFDVCESYESPLIRHYGLLFAPALEYPSYCIMSRKHPLANRERICLNDLKAQTVLFNKARTDLLGNEQIELSAEFAYKRYYNDIDKTVEAELNTAVYFDYVFDGSLDTDAFVAIPFECEAEDYRFGFVYAPNPSPVVVDFLEVVEAWKAAHARPPLTPGFLSA
jgi:DNA-binding transcriptional LysR family regulator